MADIYADPLGALRSALPLGSPNASLGRALGLPEATPAALAKTPVWSQDTKTAGLVRITAMVTDIHDMEFTCIDEAMYPRILVSVAHPIPYRSEWTQPVDVSIGQKRSSSTQSSPDKRTKINEVDYAAHAAADGNAGKVVCVYDKDLIDSIRVCGVYEFFGVDNEGVLEVLACVPHTLEFDSTPLTTGDRDHLLSLITSAVGGDVVLAHLLLFNLISKPQMRIEGVPVVGKLSLNVFNVPAEQSQVLVSSIRALYAALAPGMFPLDLLLERLGSQTYAPVKNFETGKLGDGMLVFPEHTSIVIDETNIAPQQLCAKGFGNLKTLMHLIERQELTLDFNYQQVQLPTSCPVVTISDDSKSLLPCDISVAWKPVSEVVELSQSTDQAMLAQFRKYIAAARANELTISREAGEMLETKLVAFSRSADSSRSPESTQKEMHAIVNLTRLVASSSLSSDISGEHWTLTQSLYDEVLARNPVVPTRPN